jgi:superfamily II DNA/RNA helicase
MHVTKTFRDLGVDGALCDALEAKGITHPFPIQELTLPLALKGHDLIGQARTGTGKTLAFGLPLLQRVDPDAGHTQALVIVPTRELCLQVYEDLQIGAARDLTSISVYGGVGYEEQTEALQGGAHVVVGTPGRLLDLLNRRVLDLSKVTQLVLDEADEMLDMGFLPDVERLIEACQGDDRHTMLFSATMPTAIVKLARRYMDHPTFTRADHEQKETAPNVTQHFFQVHRMDKPRLLARILQDQDRGGVYVFVRTKHMADRLVNDLEELRVPAIAIHGDLRQQTREKNLDRFRAGKATVLVCTEVAARGLDVSGVTHVVNYDCPDDEKMYLHRIGRTARAGEAGVAITFAEFNEVDRLNVIRKKVDATDTEVLQVFSTSKVLGELFTLPDDTPWDHLTKGGRSGDGRGGRNGGDRAGRDGDPRAREGGDRGGRAGGGRKGRGGDQRDDDRGRGGRDEPTDREPTTASREDGPTRGGRGGGRTARTDGRPKSGRGSEGKGGRHDADRSRRGTVPSRADEPGAETADDRGSAARAGERGSAARAGGEDAEGGSGRSRTRTRTRTRADAGAAQAGREERDPASDTGDRSGRTRARSGAERGADAEDAGRTRGGGGRQRARGGRSGGQRRDRDRGAATGADDGTDGATGASGAGGRRGDGDGDGGRAGQRERGGRTSRGGQSSERTKASGDRGRRGEERSGRGKTSGRGGTSTGRGNGGGRGSGKGRSDEPIRLADRGEEARGEGQPQLARRVKVEHLP